MKDSCFEGAQAMSSNPSVQATAGAEFLATLTPEDVCIGGPDQGGPDQQFDVILEPTTPEANPVGEPAVPGGLLHKAGWTFVSTCH